MKRKAWFLSVALTLAPLAAQANDQPDTIYIVESTVDREYAQSERDFQARSLSDAGFEQTGDHVDPSSFAPTAQTFQGRVERDTLDLARRLTTDPRYPNLQASAGRLVAEKERKERIRTAFVASANAFDFPQNPLKPKLSGLKVTKVAGRVALVHEGERMDVTIPELVDLSKPYVPQRPSSIHQVVKSWAQAHLVANTLEDDHGNYGIDRDKDRYVDIPLAPGTAAEPGNVTFDVLAVHDDGSLGHKITELTVDLDIPVDVVSPDDVSQQRFERQRQLGAKIEPEDEEEDKGGAKSGLEAIGD